MEGRAAGDSTPVPTVSGSRPTGLGLGRISFDKLQLTPILSTG